jgi:hypothetical protein
MTFATMQQLQGNEGNEARVGAMLMYIDAMLEDITYKKGASILCYGVIGVRVNRWNTVT